MDSYIRQIYELLYRPVVTPYNLLENAKLPSYKYVNYYKDTKGLVAEMRCTMESNDDAVFYYHFDQNDNLQQVYMKFKDDVQLVFDRQQEINKLTQEYLKLNSLDEKAI